MARIVVFDSGLGSLSIIKAIQKEIKSEIIYFADQKNYPYGKKSIKTLKKIIKNTITSLDKQFNPDVIVVASNTPSLLLEQIFKNNNKVFGVLPPIQHAQQISKSTICVLATKSVVDSSLFKKFLRNNTHTNKKIIGINASPLVELVESGKIFSQKNHCKRVIKHNLLKEFEKNNVDVVTLSSTHLPFLKKIFQEVFPKIKFLDPAKDTAQQIYSKSSRKQNHNKKLLRNKLCIYSNESKSFQKKLLKLNISNKVHDFDC